MTEAPVVMADGPPAPAFVSQAGSAALGARYRPAMAGRYRNRAAASLDRGNLVLGQTQNDLRVGQMYPSDQPLTPVTRASEPG